MHICRYRLVEDTRFEVLTEVLPRIKLVWNMALPKTTCKTTRSHISRRAE
jgi:hypothetical protein